MTEGRSLYSRPDLVPHGSILELTKQVPAASFKCSPGTDDVLGSVSGEIYPPGSQPVPPPAHCVLIVDPPV